MPGIFLVLLAAASLLAQARYDILLKGGHVIDPKNKINSLMDVAIQDGKIARLAPNIGASEAKRVVPVQGLYVTPGFVDLHVHVFQRPERKDLQQLNVQADAHTFRSGVTTAVDAGTSGWRDFPEFRRRVIEQSRTRVLAFLNISASGMGDREGDLGDLDAEGAARAAQANRDVVVGFKSAHFAGPGWESIDAAVKAGSAVNMPVMVDFGYLNQVRNLPALLTEKLRPGDI
ncbi:MAG: amidohydrolase family protein, partial [Gemmatales bacterium]|nr:amidohydrolase family protein [Gemmatales bacterium]